MSIRFAARSSQASVRMTRDRVRALMPVAANDAGHSVGPAQMREALQQFARHGLGAAEHARTQAMKAANAGDRQTFEWWLEICRALDRPMARRLAKAGRDEAC